MLPAGLALLVVLLPLVALLFATPWGQMGELLTAPDTRHALTLSLVSSAVTTLVAAVLGIPLAAVLARPTVRGRAVLRGLVALPMALPPVVGGLALLNLLGRRGLLGGPVYEATGYLVTYTPAAVVLAQLFVSMPFLVVTVGAALEQRDPELEEAAATMGATSWQAFRHVTLPLAWPAVTAGALLTFARALGEFGATVTVAGNVPGLTQTMPAAVYLALQRDPDTAVALGVVMLAVALVVVVGAGALTALAARRGAGGGRWLG